MAYINLKQIGELALEALTHKHMADCQCYNTDAKKDRLDDGLFVALIKTHKQGQNLFEKLTRLHQTCTDFAAGNVQSYIDDPFVVLERCFDTSSIDDLPVRIEQYSELVTLSHCYAETQRNKRKGLQMLFGNIPRYFQAIDEAGETVMIPESEMPADFLEKRAATEEIADIEMEYCLDKYNEFYILATSL